MRRPSAVRFLGFGGLVAAALVAFGGLCNVPWLVGASGVVMIVANIYAFVVGEQRNGESS